MIGAFREGDRVRLAYDTKLPDGSERNGTVIDVKLDEVNTRDDMFRVRFDGVYYANVSECVGGVNPASQYSQWYMADDLLIVE